MHVPEALETSVPVETLFQEVKKHLESKDRQKGLHLLFYGPPGTGKSKYLREIASRLGLELQIERASSLISPYVGQTENLIRRAFETAERNDGILLIDEVDTFLFDRSGAMRSWESSMVNEFLDAMESYTGVLACTTNRIDGMDPAAIRRFRRKVEFKPLSAEKARLLFTAYAEHTFGKDSVAVLNEDFERISKLPGLTPGDYAVVFENLKYTDLKDIRPGQIASELAAELELKRNGSSKRIGFS